MKSPQKNNTYTWSEKCCLPFETPWARKAKFCFLNGLNWSYLTRRKHITELILPQVSEYTFARNIPSDSFYQYDKDRIFRICPECMKNGYQSYFHLLKNVEECFLHKCRLRNIPVEEVESCKDGTYKFVNVATEKIIMNDELRNLIQKFSEEGDLFKLSRTDYIFPYYKNNEKRFYASTNRLFGERLLNQSEENEDTNYVCIQNIKVDEIDRQNYSLAMEFSNKYALFRKKNSTAPYSEDDLLENCFDMHASAMYKMTENTLGWCLFGAMYSRVEEQFDGYEDWKNSISNVKYQSEIYLSEKNIKKYAIIIAYQALTTAITERNLLCLDCRYWLRNTFRSNFRLKVYEELSWYPEQVFDSKGEARRKATQYVIYPIVNDLLHEIIQQNIILIREGKIKVTHEFLDRLTADIWKIPQYVVFYQQEKVQIYRCNAT